MGLAEQPPVPSMRPQLVAGVVIMLYYVVNSVAQNELFSAIEKGDGSNNCNVTNVTSTIATPTINDLSFQDPFLVSNTSHCGSKIKKFHKPYFITWWNHCFMMIALPPVLIYLAIAGNVKHTDVRNKEWTPLLSNAEQTWLPERPPQGFQRITWYLHCHNVTWRQLGWTAVWAGTLFMELNYLWYVGLGTKGMLASEASAAANSSFAFVWLMSLCLLGEAFDWVKAAAVLGCLAGVIMMAVEDVTKASDGGHVVLSPGILVEIGCALSQAFYFVAFRKWAIRGGKFPWLISALIAGFEGLFHLLVLWIGMLILNYTRIETFELPTQDQFEMLALGASITSTGCIAQMIGLALLPNPLIVSIAALVTTPCQFLADLIFHPGQTRDIGMLEAIGASLVVATFLVVIWRDSVLLKRQRPMPKAVSVQ